MYIDTEYLLLYNEIKFYKKEFDMIYEKQTTKNISFPIGGIGTGCIGLTGNGELNDWEIFNRPNKNTRNGYSHFAIKAKCKGNTVTKVLHGDTNENLMGTHHNQRHVGFGYGPRCNSLAGFPHFKNLRFEGNFPIAKLTYEDEAFPAVVRLCAFNPLIPHDDFNSSLPAAFFEWEIENITDEDIEYALAFSVQNPSVKSCNQVIVGENYKAILFGCADKTAEEIGYSDLTVITDGENNAAQAYWYRGTWKDPITTFWNNFSALDRLQERSYTEIGTANDHGTLVAYVKIQAGQKKKIRFVLAWNVPVQYNYWSPFKNEDGKDITWKNYYATQFENSLATAKYAISNFTKLHEQTEKFTRALIESSLPPFVIDAISANLAVLKSPTVLRFEDGSFWGWEGVQETIGSCEGSCQHVWNYAYALPFLFPKLERSLRDNTIKNGLLESGKTIFRIALPLGRKHEVFSGFCVDGQMGEVIKCYREWKISGDTAWLKANAESIFKMLEFSWSEENEYKWDLNRDGVLEGRQHHTLDVELFGANSWLQGFYLLALDCAAKIACAVGDEKREKEYSLMYQKGKAWTNEQLFNGEYFGQKIDLTDRSIVSAFDADVYYWNEETGEIKYQIGEGCLIDQMLADWHAAILGLDGVFDFEKKQKALKSLYQYNFKPSMREVTNMWRNFALNDEAGTVICSYPNGAKKPTIPIPYCEETMTGFEYALGGLMVSQGLLKEGEAVIKAIRDRYDGEKRNPWNEIECGSNYARSMASFALLPIYSGFSFDMTERRIGFAPICKGDGQYLWSVGNSWGSVHFEGKKQKLFVLGEEISLSALGLRTKESVKCVTADGNRLSFKQNGSTIVFDNVNVKSLLEIEF